MELSFNQLGCHDCESWVVRESEGSEWKVLSGSTAEKRRPITATSNIPQPRS